MIKKYISLFAVVLIAATLTVASCNPFAAKKDDNNDTLTLLALAAVALQDASYEINFNLVSGSSNVTCAGTIPGTIAGATNTTLKDARFYVHDIKLISADGSKSNFTINNESKWQIGSGTNSFGAYTGVALLDFEDKTNNCTVGTTETNKTVRGRAPKGSYTGIEFKIGVPFYLNHMNNATAVAPMDSVGMYWAWASGYKFAKIEFINGANTNDFHMGSQSCGTANNAGPVTPCGIPNIATIAVTKTAGFDTTKDTVALDLSALYNNATQSMGLTMCHGSANGTGACQPMFTNLGLDTSGKSTLSQTSFSIK
jgi:uncharacterized repeat protein (TIGR04052 family)